MNDLFDGLDPKLLNDIRRRAVTSKAEVARAAAVKRVGRHHTRRANAEAHLKEILPETFDPGDSWHVISRGDIDSLSYLRHILAGVEYMDYVLISTWCIAKNDLTELAGWLDAGKIDRLDLYVGEIFPGSYGDEYAQTMKMCEIYGCRLIVAKNHSKLMLAANKTANIYLSVESSANMNTNPRIEQTAIHHDKNLYDFYIEFFDGIKSIDKSTKTH